jgi:uncharacterized damage-inducible protein DinB
LNNTSFNPNDKATLLQLLEESREKFLESFSGLGEEPARRHVAPASWSVLDTVEHLTVAEITMYRLIAGQRRPRTPDAPNREKLFLHVMADRSRKLESPQVGRPTGRFASLSEARTKFEAARRNTLEFVRQSEEDLRATEVTHPHPAAGTVSTFEMVIIMAKHAERHALQIEEIKAGLEMPTAGAGGRG